MTGKDPRGQAAYSAFVNDFLPKYLAAERTGNLPPNALDVKDPNSMISQSMAPYKRTTGQKLNDFMSEMGVDPSGNVATPLTPPRPPALRDRDVQYNVVTQQWRDKKSGKILSPDGSEAK
jgi:hypothetical protein